jgi:hypothetical protein
MLSPKVERIKNRYGRQVEVSVGKQSQDKKNSIEKSKRLIKEIRKDIRVM